MAVNPGKVDREQLRSMTEIAHRVVYARIGTTRDLR